MGIATKTETECFGYYWMVDEDNWRIRLIRPNTLRNIYNYKLINIFGVWYFNLHSGLFPVSLSKGPVFFRKI